MVILSERKRMSRVTIDHLIFSGSVLEGALDDINHRGATIIDGLPMCLATHIGPSPELTLARATGGDGIVGVAVGQDELGGPAVWAFESDLDITGGNDGHGTKLQVGSDG